VSGEERPVRFASLVTPRHAKVAVLGDPHGATEAWLVLHGYGMTAQGILHWFRAALRPGRVLVAPEALSRFYREGKGLRTVGASWMTREDRDHEILDQQGYLDQVAERWLAGRDRVEVHGFSQGVATGCRWVAGRQRVDRLVAWGSPTPPDVEPAAYLDRIGSGPLHLVIGDRDRFFDPAVVEADAARLGAAGVPVEVHRFDGGHGIDAEQLAKFAG